MRTMKKILSIFIVLIALCLGVWVLAWGIALVSGALLFSKTLDGVAALVHMPGCVKRMVLWTCLAPFSVLAGRIFAPSRRTRVRAFLLVVSVLGVYWTITYAVNQLRPKRVDPEKVDWFSPVNGMPVLYYVHGERYDCGWEFYVGAPEMFHPGTGELMKPVSRALRRTWEADMKVRQEAAEKARLAAAQAARQAQQRAMELRQAAQAPQQQHNALATQCQRSAAPTDSLQPTTAEIVPQHGEPARPDQRVAEVQRQYDEILKATEERVTAERSSQHAPDNEDVRQMEQHSSETRAAAGTSTQTDKTPSVGDPAERATPAASMAAYNMTPWPPVVYVQPMTYSVPPVTYYYRASVQYYYGPPRPPLVVRWGYPQYRSQPRPSYWYAPVFAPRCRMRARR